MVLVNISILFFFLFFVGYIIILLFLRVWRVLMCLLICYFLLRLIICELLIFNIFLVMMYLLFFEMYNNLLLVVFSWNIFLMLDLDILLIFICGNFFIKCVLMLFCFDLVVCRVNGIIIIRKVIIDFRLIMNNLFFLLGIFCWMYVKVIRFEIVYKFYF